MTGVVAGAAHFPLTKWVFGTRQKQQLI